MDSRFCKHTTSDIKNFLSLKALQGGGVSFGDGKKGYILGVGKVGKSLGESIDNVYHVSRLKYSLLSVSNLETSHGDDLTCPIAQNVNVDMWHRRLGHVNSSLLNKLI